MEKKDHELVAMLAGQNEELKALADEHEKFERQIEEFNKRPYLTTEEAMERKRLQKMKLSGKDRIAEILADYRKQQE